MISHLYACRWPRVLNWGVGADSVVILSKPFICFGGLSDIVRKNPMKHTTMAYLWKALFLAGWGSQWIVTRSAKERLPRLYTASGITVSRRIWHLPGAANYTRCIFFQSQHNWRKVLKKIAIFNFLRKIFLPGTPDGGTTDLDKLLDRALRRWNAASGSDVYIYPALL